MIRASAPYTSGWGSFVLLKIDHIRVARGGSFSTLHRSLLPRECVLIGGVCASGGCMVPKVCMLSRGVHTSWGCMIARGRGQGGGGGYMLPRGVYFQGGACFPGVPASQGVCASRGCGIPTCIEADPPPVNRITDTSKNITLVTTSLRSVKIWSVPRGWGQGGVAR